MGAEYCGGPNAGRGVPPRGADDPISRSGRRAVDYRIGPSGRGKCEREVYFR